MSSEFNKIWKYNDKTGEYYIPNLKSFLLEQQKMFPNMKDLYEHQMNLIKNDHPKVFA